MTRSRPYGLLLLLAAASCKPSVAPFSNDTGNAIVELGDEAENWVVLINADDDPNLQVGIMDANRILDFSDNTRIAEMEAYFPPYDTKRKIVFTTEYDCAQKRSRMVSFTTAYRTLSASDPKWETYPDGHPYEIIRQFVCMTPDARKAIDSFPFRMKGSDDEIAQTIFQKIANAPKLDPDRDPFRHAK